MTTKPKTPRPIPAERVCPTCGARMGFTHSTTTRTGYIDKRRKCSNKDCKHEDRVWLKIEIVKIIDVAKKAKECEPTHNLKTVCEPTQRMRRTRSTSKARPSKSK